MKRPLTTVRYQCYRALRMMTTMAAIMFLSSASGDEVSLNSALDAHRTQAPSPTLSPGQVVRIQLEALRNNDLDGQGIELCYRFASPANKASTGPLPRFARMLESGMYSVMLSYHQAAYETMELVGDAARQRVTLYGDQAANTYTF